MIGLLAALASKKSSWSLKKVQNQIGSKSIKSLLLNRPEEAHELSTEDRVVTLPWTDGGSLPSRLKLLEMIYLVLFGMYVLKDDPFSFLLIWDISPKICKKNLACFLSRNPSTSTGGRFSMVLRFLVCLRKLCVLLLVVKDGVLLCFLGSALMLSPLLGCWVKILIRYKE